jgi:dimethylglycine catabolism A
LWRPPERIRYASSRGRVPSAAEAAASRLFSPIDIGPVRLAQRTWVPAMVPWRATAEGYVTDNVIDWYERFARGMPGAIVLEATGIRDVPSGPLLRIGHDRFLPELKNLVETVRRASEGRTRLLVQLIDFLAVRRRPEPKKFFERFLAVTDAHRAALGAPDMPEAEVRARLCAMSEQEVSRVLSPEEWHALQFGYRERVTDTHLPHIRDLPQVLPGLFAEAAARAEAAGFDGAELHYAHAYTMSSFLSRTNTRDDGYGGSLDGRVRLPLEAFREIRRRVSKNFAVGIRFLADECIEGGSGVEDASYFAVEFARSGADFLSLSRGGKFDDARQPAIGVAAYPYTGRSGYETMPQFISDRRGPFGRNAQETAAIRQAVRAAGIEVPVVCAGGIHNFEMAEDFLARGVCDIIGAARQSLADPDWFRKIRLGYGGEVRLCEYTNYCEGLDQKHKPVTCQLWDKLPTSAGERRSPDGKRRMTAPAWQPPQ